jgi:glycosyltransferase involved in cell wall biosynthesis
MKFSIITPAWNIEEWLPETIESVLSQAGDFEIEYILVIDKSKDKTLEVAQNYQARVQNKTYPIRCNNINMQILEPAQSGGMYAALTAGFTAATGDIFAWIAGDDTYQPGAFEAMKEVFETFSDVAWAKGISSTINEQSVVVAHGRAKLYYQKWLRGGVYGMESYHVEQDSVFWRATLWKKIGAFPTSFRSMGDYWLWTQFAKHARLWSVDVPVSYFRKRADQDSKVNAERCKRQMWEARGNKRPLMAWPARFFFYPYYHLLGQPSWMRALYAFFFPLQPRQYITLEQDGPAVRKMSSFTR